MNDVLILLITFSVAWVACLLMDIVLEFADKRRDDRSRVRAARDAAKASHPSARR